MTQARKSRLLWTVQGLLAALFLFAGGMKLVASPEAMQGPIELPLAFVKSIGVFEVLGALGLILPGLLRVRTDLTPLAAVGLATIMSGATVISVEAGLGGGALVPFVVGVLAVTVALGRANWAPKALSNSPHLVRR